MYTGVFPERVARSEDNLVSTGYGRFGNQPRIGIGSGRGICWVALSSR